MDVTLETGDFPRGGQMADSGPLWAAATRPIRIAVGVIPARPDHHRMQVQCIGNDPFGLRIGVPQGLANGALSGVPVRKTKLIERPASFVESRLDIGAVPVLRAGLFCGSCHRGNSRYGQLVEWG